MLVEVKQAKLEVVDFACLVKVNLVEQEPVVRKTNIKANLVHALHELTEVQGT